LWPQNQNKLPAIDGNSAQLNQKAETLHSQILELINSKFNKEELP
jgi:hypothetical protein